MGAVILRLKPETEAKNNRSLADILEFHLLTKKQKDIIRESQAAQLILYDLITSQTIRPYDYFYSYVRYNLGNVYTKENIVKTIDDLFNCGFIERYYRKSRQEISEFKIKIRPKYRLNQIAGNDLYRILRSYVGQIIPQEAKSDK